MMNRRAFIGTLAGGLLAATLAAEAQQVARPTIGILDLGSIVNRRHFWAAFREGLRDRGYSRARTLRSSTVLQ